MFGLRRQWIAVSLVSVAIAGCDATQPIAPPVYEEFVVGLGGMTAHTIDSVTYVSYDVQVADSTGTRLIEGALVRFRVSFGTVGPDTTTSRSDGGASGLWTFPGVMGSPGHTEYLSACASNSMTRCDTYRHLVGISVKNP